MGQPVPDPEAQNLAYEQQIARQVAKPVEQQVSGFAQKAAATYVVLAGGTDSELAEQHRPRLRTTLLGLLGEIVVSVSELLRKLIGSGSRELLHSVNQLDERANQKIGAAAHYATTVQLGSWPDVATVVAKANQATTTTEQTARWAANRKLAEDVRGQADLVGGQVVWVAERDACLHCLAYQGEVANQGGWFRGGLTFYVGPGGQPKPLNTGPLWSPPLHPNCRCRLQVWAGYDVGRFGPDAAQLDGVPQMLKREAQRSVLRGFSDHDSEPARLRAADVLLQGATLLGGSVERRARDDVQAGEFLSARRVRSD